MNLKCIMGSKRSQAPLIWHLEKGRLYGQKTDQCLPGLGDGGGEWLTTIWHEEILKGSYGTGLDLDYSGVIYTHQTVQYKSRFLLYENYA